MNKFFAGSLGLLFIVAVGYVVGRAYLIFYPLFFSLNSLLALPLIIAFLFLMLIKPETAFMVILLVRPTLDHLLQGTRLGGSGMGIGAGFNLAICFLFIIFLFKKRGFPRKNSLIRWWIIYLLAILASVLYSPYLFQAIRLYLNYFTYFAMAVIPFLIIRNFSDYEKYLKLLLLVVLVPVLVGLIDLAGGGWFYSADAGRRVVGAFTHPNIFAFFLVFGITLYFFARQAICFVWGKKGRSWFFIMGLSMAAVLIGTKTRSAWIACFIGFFVYGLLKDRRLVLGLLILCLGAVFVPQVHDRIMTLLSERGGPGEYEGLNSFAWRMQAWQTGLAQITKHPLLGHGLTSFKPLSSSFSTQGETFAMHNTYLEVWFDAGVVGMLSYMVLLFVPLFKFIKIYRSQTSERIKRLTAIMIGYVLGYLIVNISDNMAYYLVFNWYYWFFVGLVWVGLELEMANEKQKLQPLSLS